MPATGSTRQRAVTGADTRCMFCAVLCMACLPTIAHHTHRVHTMAAAMADEVLYAQVVQLSFQLRRRPVAWSLPRPWHSHWHWRRHCNTGTGEGTATLLALQLEHLPGSRLQAHAAVPAVAAGSSSGNCCLSRRSRVVEDLGKLKHRITPNKRAIAAPCPREQVPVAVDVLERARAGRDKLCKR